MVWRESTNHVEHCCFYSINATRVNKKKRKSLSYKSFPSAIPPVANSSDIPVPEFKKLSDLSIDEHSDEEQRDYKELTDVDDGDEDFACSSTPVLFNQHNLSDLIRDLSLSKESPKVLPSRLKDLNLLQHGTKTTFYRTGEKEFLPFFDDQLKFAFCKDIPGVLMKLGVTEYSPADWRLFIDSSKRSLKCVLLHITNVYGSIPNGHSTTLKEKYDAIKSVLHNIKYNDHQWVICVDLKMVNLLRGQQSGYTKYPWFLCYWNSRDKVNHWTKKDWPIRDRLNVGEKNVISEQLVPRDKIVFRPLHIKLDDELYE